MGFDRHGTGEISGTGVGVVPGEIVCGDVAKYGEPMDRSRFNCSRNRAHTII